LGKHVVDFNQFRVGAGTGGKAVYDLSTEAEFRIGYWGRGRCRGKFRDEDNE
jgi:hypothetical protein